MLRRPLRVRDSMLITQSVVGALGLQDRSVAWSVPMLTEYLAEKRLLLVLDNCEHVVDSAAVLAGTLLRACPDLRILATSRQALGVAGEVVEEVPPLSLPGPEDASTADALRSDAVSLFVERATASRPGFARGYQEPGCRARAVSTTRRCGARPRARGGPAQCPRFGCARPGLRDRLDLSGPGIEVSRVTRLSTRRSTGATSS